MDENSLRNEIKQAREAETKAKAQIYTLRGKKGLQAMAAAMGEDLPDHLMEKAHIYEDPEDSPQIQELRRQIALIREMEKQQLDQIEELKRKKAERGAGNSQPQLVEMPQVRSSANFEVQQASTSNIKLTKEPEVLPKVPSYADFPKEQPQQQKTPSYASFPNQGVATPVSAPAAQQPPQQPAQPAQPAQPVQPVQIPSNPSSSGIVSPRSSKPSSSTSSKRGKKDKVSMQAPDSLEAKVLNASWDSGASKSKKTNKVCTYYLFRIISRFIKHYFEKN